MNIWQIQKIVLLINYIPLWAPLEEQLHISPEHFKSNTINASLLLLLNCPVLHYCLILKMSLCSQLIQLSGRVEITSACIILPALSVPTPKLLPVVGKTVVLQYGSPKCKPWDILHPGKASFTIQLWLQLGWCTDLHCKH